MLHDIKGLCEFLDEIGTEAAKRYHNENISKEEKAFYLGHINIAACIAHPILRGKRQGELSLNYKETKEKYDTAYNTIYNRKPLNELSKLLDKILEMLKEDNTNEKSSPKKKSTKKE